MSMEKSPPINRASPGSWWAFVPVALLALMLGGLLTMAALAQNDPGFALERDYYQKAVHYEQEIAQRAENARLGWRVRGAVGTERSSSNPARRTLTARVEGAGSPITGARVTVYAVRNASAARVIEAELVESASERGTYRAELPLTPGGLWEFRFTVVQGEARYTESVRLDVLALNERPNLGLRRP